MKAAPRCENAESRGVGYLFAPIGATDNSLNVAFDGYRAAFGSPLVPTLTSRSRDARSFARSRTPIGTRIPDMITGTVKFFNADKGYGFIAPESGGNDAFVHISAVERAGLRTLEKDQRISYDLENDQRGKASAVNLQIA
jgi:CspA family cold shock protein